MKSNNKKLAARILLMLALGLYHAMPVAYALPSQGTLDNTKAATIATSGNIMNIAGKGKNNILNWANFQIGKGETVKFNDKNNYLNLVHGVDISRIYGTLSGGNIVYLVNPNGILFGQGAKLDNVGSFVASTRNISAINKEAFLRDPSDTVAVLGTDNPVMDNKDYYPEDSSYVPKISVAEMQLTNVPESATKIILDGPGGVILKNTGLLDQTTQVATRKDGGEIGVGSEDGTVALTEVQKSKIALLDGDKAYAYDEGTNVLQGYIAVDNIGKLSFSGVKYMLVNDLDASKVVYPFISNGTLEGMGYTISNVRITARDDYFSYAGLFEWYSGEIRNLVLNDVNVKAYSTNTWSGGAGGLVAQFDGGIISNVEVDGYVSGSSNVGGIVGRLSDSSEIRNSTNYAAVSDNADDNRFEPFSLGGIVGIASGGSLSLFNVANKGAVKGKNDQWGGYVGGIIGRIDQSSRSDKYLLQGIYNSGEISGINSYMWLRYINVGGVVGGNDAENLVINETYNVGITKRGASAERGHLGGLVGENKGNVTGTVSKITGALQQSYYLSGNLNGNSEGFGIGLNQDDMNDINRKDMIGVYDFSTYHGDVTSGIPDTGEVVPPVNPEPDAPVVPPVNPEPDTPIVPPVNPEPDTPVVPPVEPEPDVPVVPPVNPEPDAPVVPPVDPKPDDSVVKIPSDYDGVINGVVNYDKEYNRIDIKELNDLYKNYQEKIKGGLELVTWEREKIKNDRRKEAKEVFESKDYSDIIPENEIRNVIFSDEEYKGYLDIDGNMSVKNIKTGIITGNKNIKVTFDVYNRESISGVVEVYDNNGKMIRVVWIDPLINHAESVDEAIGDFSKLVETDKLTAAITPVDIDVPAGGYFRITNNADNSLELKVHNGVNHFLDVAGEVVDWICLALPDSTSAAVKEALYVTIKDAVIDELKSLPVDFGEDYVPTAINKAMDNLLNGNGENPLFTALVDNVKKDLSSKGVIGSAAEFTFNVVTSPIKVARELFFTSKGTLNVMDRAVSKNVVKNTKATNFVVAY